MRKCLVLAVLCGASLAFSGCLPLRRTLEARHVSLKDDAPPPPAATQRAAVAPVPPPTAPLQPRGTQSIAVDAQARAEQWQRCAQRHVDYQAGRLNETVEQKRLLDEICAELHRTDHARESNR